MSAEPDRFPSPRPADAADAAESGRLAAVRAAIEGEAGAFERLVVAYADRLRELIRRQIDPALRARLSADDLLQETLIVASNRVRGIVVSREGEFWAWLRSIAEQRLIDARRRHMLAGRRDARRSAPLPEPGHGAEAASLARLCPPSRDARAAESGELIERAMSSLPASYRDVIRLRIIEGLPTSAAAEAMGRTPGALSVLLCKAVKRLGEALEVERANAREVTDGG